MSRSQIFVRAARSGLLAFAGVVLASAALSAQTLVIEGGTVHGPDGPIQGTVLVDDGKIVAVGEGVEARADAPRIDATGKHVYPGLFDAFSRLGLTEIGSIAATQDTTEVGAYNPHLVAATAIHPASEAIPVTRANGITHALSAPGSGGGFGFGGGDAAVIPGQATVIELDGWTVEEMALEPTAALVVQWPSLSTTTFDFATFSRREKAFSEAKKEYDQKLDELRDWIDAGRHYQQAIENGDRESFARNLALEALVPYLERKHPVIVVANRAREIRDAVAFAEEEGLELILAGGDEAWKEKELLAEKDVPVILAPTQRLPGARDEPYDQPFRAPAELVEAGVRIAFASFDAARSRRLPVYAGTAVAFGLSAEAALDAVTRSPAEILGLGDRLGTIERGKIANLIVTDGDPLEVTTQIEHLVIGGREVSTENKHSRLYERYRGRPTR